MSPNPTTLPMKGLEIRSNPSAAQQVGVINPYALAEQVAGRRIPWQDVANVPQLLEDLLDTPYHELFDPKFEGPLYMGLKLDSKKQLVQERSPLLDVRVEMELNDLERPTSIDLSQIKTLGDLAPHFHIDKAEKIEVSKAEVMGRGRLVLTLRVDRQARLQQLARVFRKELVEAITFVPGVNPSPDWTPANAMWSDPGDFFQEAAEFFDPIQGAVPNCYYIAALSAVAWAKPYLIQHMTRATGVPQQAFTNLIRFQKPDGGGPDREIEVTDTVPLTMAGNFIYARSSEAGEIWPAVYEKAYAKLKTGITGDHPDITATGWGDCVYATAQLTGATRHYYGNPALSADQIWNLVRANSMGGRTFNPMTAWTYSTADAAEHDIHYADANIVGSHAYTILGWDYRNERKYIILRNPWGRTEATVGTLADTVWLYDISWWRPINLINPDGTFAIEASAFKTYFAGLGVVR